jgi:hypothetical protein
MDASYSAHLMPLYLEGRFIVFADPVIVRTFAGRRS